MEEIKVTLIPAMIPRHQRSARGAVGGRMTGKEKKAIRKLEVGGEGDTTYL